MWESQRRLFREDYNFIDINSNPAQLTQEVEITLKCCFIFRNFGIIHINVILTPCVWCLSYISEAVGWRYSVKKGVLRNFAKLAGKHLCHRLFFNKVADLRPATLFKKRHWHRCFPMNFTKFLRIPFLQNTYGGCFWHFPLGIAHQFFLFIRLRFRYFSFSKYL